MTKIYGNGFLKDSFESMCKSGRLPHGFIIYGEKGLGKKTAALYMAKTLLCEKSGNVPCNDCRSCRNIDKGIHPDLIFPEQSGKLMTYSVETCRQVCADSIVAPNNGDRKVYLFADADNIKIPAQNSLLKLIEEPPDFVYFIFTAVSKDSFLSTILSRVVSIGVSPCSDDECAAALALRGYDSGQIQKAMEVFRGNIGMCIQFLEDENLQKIAQLTKKAADSIINRDEYSLLTAFSSDVLKDRNNAAVFLEMFDKVIRDAAVTQIDPENRCISCCPAEALKLGGRLSAVSAEKIHKAAEKAAADYRANVSQTLVMAGLCAEIMDCGRGE